MFSDLGSQVTVLEALPTLLPGCDSDVVERGGAVVPQAGDRRPHRGAGHRPHARTARGPRSASATARRVDRRRRRGVGRPPPLTEGLLAEGTGVARRRAGLRRRRRVPCAPRPTGSGRWATWSPRRSWPTSGFAEGILVDQGDPRRGRSCPVDYARVPWAIYCHPEVAFAGLTEAQAKEAGIDVVVKKDPYGGNSRARIMGETDGLVKVVAERLPDGPAGRILGVHMVGPVGDRAAGPGLPGGELGGHGRRGGAVHPAASHAVRGVRRDSAGPHRKGAARWLTSPCRSSARR